MDIGSLVEERGESKNLAVPATYYSNVMIINEVDMSSIYMARPGHGVNNA